MPLAILKRPSETIEAENSNWVLASNTPVIYRTQRKDYIVNNVDADGSNVTLASNNLEAFTDIEVGDIVMFTSNNGVYQSIVAEVIDKDTFTGPGVAIDVLELNSPWISNIASNAGWINLISKRLNYRVEVNLYDRETDAKLVDTQEFYPNTTGYCLIDAAVISTLLFPEHTNTAGTWRNNLAFRGFYLGYKEVWDESAESEELDDDEPIFAVFGSAQIGSTPNLYDYSLEDEYLFLSKVTRPKIASGIKSYTSVIVPIDNIAMDLVHTIVVKKYKAGIEVSATGTATGTAGIWNVEITTDYATADRVDVAVYATDLGGDTQISELKVFDVVEPCPPFVNLMWKNTLGGIEQFQFDFDQEYGYKFSGGKKVKRMKLFKNNVTNEEYEAVAELNTMGEVFRQNIIEFTTDINRSEGVIGQQVYVVTSSGALIGVTVNPVSIEVMTRNSRHSVEVEIEFPQINTQR
jgi:hypothetical protein